MRYGPWPRRGRLLRPGAGHGHGPRGHGWRSRGRSTDPPPVPGRTRSGQSKTRRTTTERSDLRGVWGHVAPTRSASTEARLARPPALAGGQTAVAVLLVRAAHPVLAGGGSPDGGQRASGQRHARHQDHLPLRQRSAHAPVPGAAPPPLWARP